MKISNRETQIIRTAEITHLGETYNFWWKRTDDRGEEFSIVQKNGGVVILEGTPLFDEIVSHMIGIDWED